MAYKKAGFTKTANGVVAPKGFHYMANGRLMNDADHIAVHGYIEKKIKSVSLDYSDIAPTGGSKTITIKGDVGLVFSIEVFEGDMANYYNFKTRAWGAASYKQTNIRSASKSHNITVDFPEQTSLKTITINVYAETVENIKTKHAPAVEVRHVDGSLNINESTGSNSNVVTKVIYQDVIKNLYISTIAPSKTDSSTAITNGAVSGNRMILHQDATDPNIVQVGDLIACTGILSALGVLVTKINPDGDNIHEIEMSATDIVGDGVTVTFYPAFRGMIPNNISSTVGRAALEVVSGSSNNHSFLITLGAIDSRGFSSSRLPTAGDLCVINPITFGSAALLISGEDIYPTITTVADSTSEGGTTVNGASTGTTVTTHVLSAIIATVGDRVLGNAALAATIVTVATVSGANTFTMSEAISIADDLPLTFSNHVNYRWPVTNIANLTNGMVLDPSRTGTGLDTNSPASISDYSTSQTFQRIDESNRYYTDFTEHTQQDIFVSGVDSNGVASTAIDRNGRITAQTGNITFSVQQPDALKSDAGVLLIAQGVESIKQATGMEVEVSNVTITPTQVSTTTTAASSASTTVALTEVGKIRVGQSVRGVGINSAVANPTVVSKSAATGPANIVVSSAQTLEEEVTLYFDGSSSELVIRGTISIQNAPIIDTTLYFNVERFLGIG